LLLAVIAVLTNLGSLDRGVYKLRSNLSNLGISLPLRAVTL